MTSTTAANLSSNWGSDDDADDEDDDDDGGFDGDDFDDFDGRLNDSFFKYVIRTDDYDKNEVPWGEGGKPVRVQMSAYLRKVPNIA